MKTLRLFHVGVLFLVFATTGCATYQYSKNVKMLSFDDDVQKGKSVGPVRGDDCIYTVLGYRFGGATSLDRALASARTQTEASIGRSFSSEKQTMNDKTLRYINNVSTENDGFNVGFFAKDCLVVKGTG